MVLLFTCLFKVPVFKRTFFLFIFNWNIVRALEFLNFTLARPRLHDALLLRRLQQQLVNLCCVRITALPFFGR
jgi:hypothetical protein